MQCQGRRSLTRFWTVAIERCSNDARCEHSCGRVASVPTAVERTWWSGSEAHGYRDVRSGPDDARHACRPSSILYPHCSSAPAVTAVRNARRTTPLRLVTHRKIRLLSQSGSTSCILNPASRSHSIQRLACPAERVISAFVIALIAI